MPTLADQIAPKPQQPSGLGGWLASIGDELAGAFARYGRRSGAQRDASLELLNQASAPGTDPIMGAGQKLLGLAGLITHPLAFFPTREEWDQRLQAAGNDSRLGRSIGGFLSDLPSLIDPQMAAGGAATVAPAIFAGMMAKTADLNKLKQAEKLAELGHSAEDIHDMTGWFKGVDDKWRFEIDDSTSTLTDKIKHTSDPVGIRAKYAFSHPDLYAAYPQLAETKLVSDVPEGASGAAYGGRVGIRGGMQSDDTKSILLHELQHEIQNIEGFAKGGNVAEFASVDPEVAKDAFVLKKFIDHAGDVQRGIERFANTFGRQPASGAIRHANFKSLETLADARDPYKAYMSLSGEVEPRNVQARMSMSADERAASFPLSTQDVATELQKVRGVGASRSAPSSASRGQSLQNLVGEPQRGQLVTQSYKDTLPDGTTRWVPGTLRVNPPTSRFQPEMTPADIKRYIEEHGEAPTPRAKGELVTQSYKEVYPDGTVRYAPGTLRTRRVGVQRRGEP